MRYLLDTNICIYLIKRQPPQVIRHLESKREGDVVMSALTYAELRAGLEMRPENRARDEQALEMLAMRIPVLPFDEEAARCYGVLRAAVPDRRRHAIDRLLAAHALAANLILVTNNAADFTDYPGVVVENWADPAR